MKGNNKPELQLSWSIRKQKVLKEVKRVCNRCELPCPALHLALHCQQFLNAENHQNFTL